MSLTSRLLLGFAIIAGIGFWLMIDQVLSRVERQYLEAAEEPMVDMANVLAEMLARDVDDAGEIETGPLRTAFAGAKARELEAKIYSFIKTRVDMDVYVTDEHGVVLYDSLRPERVGQRNLKRDVLLALAGAYGARSSLDGEEDSASAMMYVAAPVRAQGKIVGVVSVAKPQSSTFKFRDETRSWLKRTLGSLILCMVLGSGLLARWTTRPIRRLTDYAGAITRGERPPVPDLHGSEMRTLGAAFEKMRDVLENRESVERYVQTLTHELKSPVAAIRGASELLQEPAVPGAQREKFLQNIQAESLRLQDLLDRLLALSALEKQKFLEDAVKVNLSDLAHEICDGFEPLLTQKDIHIERWIQEGVEVHGDGFLLRMALGNLLQNSLDFTPAGGEISVGLKTVDDRACFLVEDTGPGLPDYAKNRVFERFYSLPRPQTGKKSSGLGLCFVREAALLHRGTAELENRENGGGARALFSMPLA